MASTKVVENEAVQETKGGRRRGRGGYRGMNYNRGGGRMSRVNPRRLENQSGAKIVLTAEAGCCIGDFLRCMFHIGGTEFIDRVVTSEEFETQFKALTPSGFHVLLEVGDEFFDSCLAIDQYCALRSGLVPEEPTRRLRTHMIYAVFDDALHDALYAMPLYCPDTKACSKDCSKDKCAENKMGCEHPCSNKTGEECKGPCSEKPCADKPCSDKPCSEKPCAENIAKLRAIYLDEIVPKLQKTEKMLSQYSLPHRQLLQRTGGGDRFNITYLDVAIGIFIKQLLIPLSQHVGSLTPEQQITAANYPIMFAVMSKILEHPKVKKVLMTAQPKIKLTYFDSIGRAEPIRWALTLAGLEFEDKRISIDEWPEVKKTSPSGMCPMLEIEGEGVFTESLAMLTWAASQGGLIPQTEEGNLHALAVVQLIENCIHPISLLARRIFMAQRSEAKPEATKQLQAQMNEFCENVLPLLVANVDALVSRYQDAEGHVVGGKLSYIDLLVAATYLNLVYEKRLCWIRDPKALCPSMQRCYKLVSQIEVLREFGSCPRAKPVLYYFGIPGRAEPCRLAMAVAGIDFEDKRFGYDDWMKVYKQGSPSKQCPYLVVGAEVICETRAILQWIGERGGLIPDTLMGRVRADALFTSFAQHVWTAQRDLYPFAVGTPEREAAAKNLRDNVLNDFWKFYEEYIKEQQDCAGYCVEGELSWADLFVAGEISHCLFMKMMPDDWITKYPCIFKVYNMVYTKLPAITEFQAKRVPF